MFEVIKYDETVDLSEFYREAGLRGHKNNSSKHMLIDTISKERESVIFLLKHNNNIIGSCAAHSFDEMGENSYRIAARTCIFTDMIKTNYGNNLRTISVITQHQNPTAQFFIPACISWAPKNAKLYITSNESEVGTQRAVDKIFCPSLERLGQLKFIKKMNYRGLEQKVWLLKTEKFLEALGQYDRW